MVAFGAVDDREVTVSPDGQEPRPGTGPRYTVAAVARRLGVAPATLRTWDRRYGVGPSEHAYGEHRRYTRADVALLLRMRRLVLDGVAPADAAMAARAGEEPSALPAAPGADAYADPGARPGPPDPDVGADPDLGPQPDVPAARDPSSGRAGGGHVLRIPGATSQVRGLARAALMLDTATMTATVRAAVRTEGTARAWHGLLVPVLTALGERWAATGEGVEVEHLLSDSVLVAFREVRLAARIVGEDRVLLACAAGDYHSLPVLVVAAALAERGIGCRVAGPAVPPEALAAAVRRVRPLSLFCWSSMPSTGDPGYLDDLPALSPAVSVVVGGPGWRVGRLAPKVDVAVDVPTAVAAIAARLGR